MDKELIFYIVFGLIYLISRASRKKKQKQAQQAPPQVQPQKRSTPVRPSAPVSQGAPQKEQPEVPMSFEDILRELSGEGRKTIEQPIPEPVAEPEPEPVVKPEPANPWESEILEQPFQETIPDYAFTSQEQNTTDASDLWSRYRNTEKGQSGYRATILEEIEEDRLNYKFSPYSEKDDENTLSSDIREMLQDPDDIRKAVILSEILPRRY